MNDTAVEWAQKSWNVITGCYHACRNQYCYNTMKNSAPLNRFGALYIDERGEQVRVKDWRKREKGGIYIARRGERYPYGYAPTYHPARLDMPKKRKKPARIFVVDTGDLFGKWVPAEWINSILDVVRVCPQHTFIFLTKNPVRLLEFSFPRHAWVGTSISTTEDSHRVDIIKKTDTLVRFLSIEPLLGPLHDIDFLGLQWIILGAQTGRNAPLPDHVWVDDIVNRAKALSIPVFIKNNLKGLCDHAQQEYPQSTDGPAQQELFPREVNLIAGGA